MGEDDEGQKLTLSGRSAVGDVEEELVLAPGAPILVLDTVAHVTADGALVNLEPITGTVVALDAARGLGHVHLHWAGVLNEAVVGLESNAKKI